MKKQNIPSHGFTVIELLLYMGIFSILLVVLMEIFTSILSVHAESQGTSQVAQDGTYILTRLSNDIHRASIVAVIVGGNPQPLGTLGTEIHITNTTTGLDETFKQNGNDVILKDNTIGYSESLNSSNTDVTVNFQMLGNTITSLVPSPRASVLILLTVTSKTIQPGGIQQAKTFETTVQTR